MSNHRFLLSALLAAVAGAFVAPAGASAALKLFAVTEAGIVAESLPYGPNPITESSNAYLSTVYGNVVHDRWVQVVTTDGSNVLFTIDWQFVSSKTLQQRFIDAVGSGEPVDWSVDAGSTPVAFSGVWRFSGVAGDMAARFAGSGSSFSDDDGIWGANNNVIDGNGGVANAAVWGHGNWQSVDPAWDSLWLDGIETRPISDEYPELKNYLYLETEPGAATPEPSAATVWLLLATTGIAVRHWRRRRKAA